jgi:CheY-like chemotaxis protein
MNAIVGFSELALSEELDPKIHEYIVDIRSASHNLLAIINDILDISKIESGKMELVCGEYYTKNLFNDVFLIVDGQTKKKGLKFKMSVADDMPKKMYGDKIRIRGVLINLLNNAVKYTDSGSVELQAQVLDKTDDIATLKLSVKDTGIGISKEDREKLFESFSQVDKTVNYGKEGTGLGLAIVQGFVELMGGEVSVESEYGKGSTFTVIIKQKILDDGAADKIYTSSDEVSEDYGISDMKLEDVRVLVVDDNIMNLKMAKSSMEHYGLTTDIAGSGKLAVEMCRNTHYQIVFMDQMMPVMDGVEAMKEIRKLDKHYELGGPGKIIILTANTMNGMREQMMAEGFDEFLGKPLNFKQLERLLKRFLPGQIRGE